MTLGRRGFLEALIGVAAAPLSALAQQLGGVRRVIVLMGAAETT